MFERDKLGAAVSQSVDCSELVGELVRDLLWFNRCELLLLEASS
jgi:hypothetical protein